jgi:hypothetical protein
MQSSALLNKAGNPGGEIPIAKRSLALICVPKQELGNEMEINFYSYTELRSKGYFCTRRL